MSEALRSALSADLSYIALAAAIIGVCFHIAIRDVEVDYRLWRMAAIYAATSTLLMYSFVKVCDYSIFQAWFRTIVANTGFNVGLAGSIGIYRLLFHRIRHFPGPLGAKLSRFYTATISAKNLQYHYELEKMHEQYGDFVRTGECSKAIGHQLVSFWLERIHIDAIL